MSPSLNPKQIEVLCAVAAAGALTSRRVVQEYGPLPNWYRLLTERLLTESCTLYGKILHLTPRGHALLAQSNLPKLWSASTAADRAYQNDALRTLLAEGYTVDEFEYQRAGGRQCAALEAQGKAPYTDAIISVTLQVPQAGAHLIYMDTWQQVQPLSHITGFAPAQLGHPRLYASIRGGGITLLALRKLYRRHRLDTAMWHHPLLLAVPDPQPLKQCLRAWEVERRQFASGYRITYPLVRLIHLPLPDAG